MTQQPEPTYSFSSFNIMLIGDPQIGKSSILARLPSDPKSLHPAGMNFCVVSQSFNDGIIRFQVWNSQGHRRHWELQVKYYRNVNGFLLIYDITKRESFENLTVWLERSKACASPNAEYVLLGNCCDLEEERQVSYEEGREFAKKHEMVFFEVSAKTGENIKCAMKTLGKSLLNLKLKEKKSPLADSFAEKNSSTEG